MTTVVDASAYLDLLLDVIPAPVRTLFGGELVAPAIFHSEVAGALAGCERRGLVDADFAEFLLREFLVAPVTTVADRTLLERAFAFRPNVSVRDGCYVALAEELGCGLLTSDRRLANAPGLPVPVTLV